MNMSNLASNFRELHDQDDVLILPNAWDAGSARIIEDAGAKAIATTSAGVSWAYGYPDGDALPPTMLAILVSHITDVIRVPLSVDVEGVYTNDIKQVGENIRPILEACAVGINIEDGEGTPELLAKKIIEVRKVAQGLGVNLFINARTDVFLRGIGEPESRLEEVIRRAALYREVGADGIFIPGLCEPEAIETIVPEVKMPVNVLACPGLPNAKDLKKLGVSRLSSGAGIPKVMWKHVSELAKSFLETGDSQLVFEKYMESEQLQNLFAR